MGTTHKHPVFHHPSLVVRACEFGWGVFASSKLPADEIVERCPFLVVPASATVEPPLSEYVFMMTDDPADPMFGFRAMPLGWGGLFNHNNTPNLHYVSHDKRKLLEFSTTREIAAGEQLFVSYGPKWWSKRGKPGGTLRAPPGPPR